MLWKWRMEILLCLSQDLTRDTVEDMVRAYQPEKQVRS